MRVRKLFEKLSGIIILLPIIIYLIITRDVQIFLILTAAAIHECGHIIAAAASGKAIRSFSTGIGGAVIITSELFADIGKKLVILLSGAAANLAAYGITLCVCNPTALSGACGFFASANLALAVFNLLPIGGLDGGEALFCILERFLLPHRAYFIRQIVSFLTLFLLWVLAAFLVFHGSANISLFITAAVLFTVNFRESRYSDRY